jgi:hypothetical protein
MLDPTVTVAVAAFSQYPRGYCATISRSNPNPNCWPLGELSQTESSGALSRETAAATEAAGWHATPSPCFKRCTMGYSMVTQVDGREYRYTEWVDFGTIKPLTPDWSRLVGTEMYDHGTVTSTGVTFEENVNVADDPTRAVVRKQLHTRLMRGPLTGGGWGPWSYNVSTGAEKSELLHNTPLKTDDSTTNIGDYMLNTINLTQHPNAKCLDGTASTYYFRKSNNTKKFFLFHEGGGWCSPDVPFSGGVGIDHCYNRSLGGSGSSKFNPKIKPLPLTGSSGAYFSYDRSTNPILWDANSVLINYCDGGAFSGRRTEPMTILGRPLFFQGSFILDAIADDLNKQHGLAQATEVVIGGCSAGGHGAILQVDPWRVRLPPSAFVTAMPDSGFFVDWSNSPAGSSPLHSFHTDLGSIYHSSNASVNQACVSAHVLSGADPTKCFFAEHTMPYVRTPTFLLQSIFDAWQTGNILGSSDPEVINAYGKEVAARLTELVFAPTSAGNATLHGGFIDACWHHCSDKQWFVESIDGVTMRDAFSRWYMAHKMKWQVSVSNLPRQHVYWQRHHYPCSSCCGAANRSHVQHDHEQSYRYHSLRALKMDDTLQLLDRLSRMYRTTENVVHSSDHFEVRTQPCWYLECENCTRSEYSWSASDPYWGHWQYLHQSPAAGGANEQCVSSPHEVKIERAAYTYTHLSDQPAAESAAGCATACCLDVRAGGGGTNWLVGD